MKTHRTDLLGHRMNAAKEAKVREVLRAWRRCAVQVGREQWRLFFESGSFNKYHRNPDENGLADIAGAANRVQMVRHQVVGTLDAFLSNRENDFRRIVERSSLSDRMKHELHVINVWNAWFSRLPLPKDKKTTVQPSAEAFRLARRIMRQVLSKHRKPDLSRINMVVDHRAAKVRPAESAKGFPLWIRLSTMKHGRPIDVPVETHEHFEARKGKLKRTVQVNERDGRLYFGLVTDTSEAFEAQREDYEPQAEEVALDWGLRSLFVTDTGDLLGRGFIKRLGYYDRRITALAGHRQKQGLPVRSPRYDREVRRLQGFVRSEVGRILTRLVATRAPGRLIVEKLDFRNPKLSKRMNRLLTNAGQKAVEEKFADLEERFGIDVAHVNPAYSSQQCSRCSYVDPKNRSGEHFRCRWCNKTLSADVNAARNLGPRRSRPEVGSVAVAKTEVLRTLVLDFQRQSAERSQGRRGTSRDPRAANRYFKRFAPEVTLTLCADASPPACASGT